MSMSGETELATLLRSMTPVLEDGEYVFCRTREPMGMLRLDALGCFRENEGWTLILPREQAQDAGLPLGPVFRRITLSVHSSLEAVGFLAAVSGALAGKGISVNAVSAYYHDHLFVPAGREQDAMAVLGDLARA